jgi:hypothetical protein
VSESPIGFLRRGCSGHIIGADANILKAAATAFGIAGLEKKPSRRQRSLGLADEGEG